MTKPSKIMAAILVLCLFCLAQTKHSAVLENVQTWTALQTFGANAAIGSNAHGVLLSENASAVVSTTSGAAGQIFRSGGAGSDGAYFTFPDTKYAPAANNVNGTAGIGWTCPNATPAGALRAGSNNLGGLLSPWGSSDVCYIQWHLDKDVDLTTTLPYLMIELTSTDVTNGHTIIMQEATACAKLDGTTTDDVAYNAARSFSTVTLNTTANQTWQGNIQLNSTDLTGCTPPSIMWTKITRTTDTATNVGVYGISLTKFRLLTTQAN